MELGQGSVVQITDSIQTLAGLTTRTVTIPTRASTLTHCARRVTGV